MLKDIEIKDPHYIIMHKKLWAEVELSLAACLGFRIDIEFGDITCDLTITRKASILEFLKESFQRVWNHPAEANFKAEITGKIDDIYKLMYYDFRDNTMVKLEYQEKLYKHQKEALFVCLNKHHNFISFEQGLGKTLIAGSVSKMLGIKRTLVICPASLKHNWLKELCGPVSKFNEMYFSILDASKSRTIRAFQERFVICNYDSLDKHMAHILSSPIGHIIIDEATAIKSTSTNRFKVVEKIIKANPETRVTLLSGTPVRNRINDLFAYLKIVGHPLGDNYAKFIREYTLSSKGRGNSLKITGAKNTDKLWRETSNFMFRKKKDECLDLPEKVYSRLYFELDDYKEEYDKAVKEALEKSGKTNLSSSIHTINIVTSKAKLKGCIEFIENIIEQGQKIVVFTGYTEIIELLNDHFKEKCVMINGSVHSKDRSDRVDRFMNDESCMVFLGNTIAAGTGLTLTAASNTLFCDFPFSPADLVQAEDRTHRIGQKSTANYYYAMCEDSVDEQLFSLIAEKAHDASKVIDNVAGEFGNQNMADLIISSLREKYNVPANGKTEEV